MTCPRCSFDNHEFAIECEKCGVVFSKLERSTRNAGLEAGGPADLEVSGPKRSLRTADFQSAGPPTFRRPEPPWKLLAIGVIGAMIAHAFWPLSAALGALKTLFHELGHAVVAWSLGHPSIPAFDFMFGGGITHYGEFRVSLALAIAAGFGYLGWRMRNNMRAVAIISAVFVVWLIIVTKDWRRETVMASAGVAFELLLAATFLYMVIANVGWRIPEIERPLGSIVAFFVQFSSWIFAIRLIRDREFLGLYQEGKGGAMMNDLEIVALNLKIYLGMDATIQSVAKMLFIFSFVPMGLAFWLALRHERFANALQSGLDLGD